MIALRIHQGRLEARAASPGVSTVRRPFSSSSRERSEYEVCFPNLESAGRGGQNRKDFCSFLSENRSFEKFAQKGELSASGQDHEVFISLDNNPLIPTEFEPVHEVVRTPRPKVKSEPGPMAVVSSELIPIQRAQLGESEVNAVSGRDLHAFLEVGKIFAAWMPEQIEAFGFAEGQDFEVLSESGKNPLGGRPSKEYMVSISMAKELAMVQRGAA